MVSGHRLAVRSQDAAATAPTWEPPRGRPDSIATAPTNTTLRDPLCGPTLRSVAGRASVNPAPTTRDPPSRTALCYSAPTIVKWVAVPGVGRGGPGIEHGGPRCGESVASPAARDIAP